jgi:hypothetical protein
MTGDTHNNDDADFLDEDFVVEDIVGKNDDLEDLFDEPAQPEAEDLAAADDPADKADADKDEDDLLFTDHTEGLDAEEPFQKPTFAEDGESQWSGEELDLESVGDDTMGVPDATLEDEEAMADPELVEAKETFASELDSMLGDEEDFALDSEADLQLVGDDGISEFEQSGPFVLDDGEGLWSDEAEAEADGAQPLAEQAFAEQPGDEQPAVGAFDDQEQDDTFEVADDQTMVAEGNPFVNMTHELPPEPVDASEAPTQVGDGAFDELDEVAAAGGAEAAAEHVEDGYEEMQLLDAAEGGEVGGAGWEPLPATSVDALSEVDEIQRADEVEYDTSGYEEDEVYDEAEGDEPGYEDEYAEHEYTPEELEGVDGHDIYAEDEDEHEAVVVGGPGSGRRRSWSLLLSLAASVMILGLAATVVVRPAWFGLSVEPEQVARVEVPRPRVELDVAEPPKVEAAVAPNETQPSDTDPEAPTTAPTSEGPTQPNEVVPSETQPGETQPGETQPAGNQPGETQPGENQPNPTAPVDPPTAEDPPQPQIGQGEPSTTTPDVEVAPTAGGTEGPVAVDAPKPDSWPVAPTAQEPEVEAKGETLARFGDNLLVGGMGQGDTSNGNALDGVLPGSRAFAQLHNGNYFIGKVKQIAGETITLRVDTGEVTLPTIEIAQLTRLGSNDYDELQRATKGFVRLTNNNRLVGGILSRIADDHIVLEFRSNRVMLPKSVVGEIVSGEDDSNVRLGTTREEDNWLKKIAERELGNGRGAEVEPKPKTPGGAARSGPPR